jgi:hypothetical protein
VYFVQLEFDFNRVASYRDKEKVVGVFVCVFVRRFKGSVGLSGSIKNRFKIGLRVC